MVKINEIIELMYDVVSPDWEKAKAYINGSNICKGLRKYIESHLNEYGTKLSDEQTLRLIADAMNDYIIEYTAPVSYKEVIRNDFKYWFTEIATEYRSNNEKPSEIFDETVETPIKMNVVDLIKQLHPHLDRENDESPYVTKKELRERYKHFFRKIGSEIGNTKVDKNQDKTITNMINALDPDRKDGKTYYIGGQPVKVKVKYEDIREEDATRTVWAEQQKIRHYYTPNTMHPIILQANVYQVGTILEGLHLNNFETDNQIAFEMAVDIWCQLSDYGKERLRVIFGKQNEKFMDFLDEIEDYVDGDRLLGFFTEREIIEQGSYRDKLRIACKSGETIARIKYKDTDGTTKWLSEQRVSFSNVGEKEGYCFTSPENWNRDIDKIKEKTVLDLEQIDRLEF